VLALGGDDPLSKSSTLPSHSEVAFYDALFPVLFPGNVQEILDLGRFGFELSRYSGLWVGFKIVTNVADEIGSALVAPDRVRIVDPGFTWEGRPWRHSQNPTLLPPFGLEMEREIHYGRLEAAKAFAAAHPLNRITVPTPDAWLGIVAAGKAFTDVRQALRDLGLDDDGLRRAGIRLLRLGMIHRNTYINGPTVLRETWQTKFRDDLFFAGQISGVEGYVESAASGLIAHNQGRLGKTLHTDGEVATGRAAKAKNALQILLL
jgi:indolepyruvate ferredoxin oxidoreductase